MEDPLEAKGLLQLATIYRDSELKYVYVCYHCGSSFKNISDTLNHVESHLDAKVNIVDGHCDKIVSNLLIDNVNRVVPSDDNNPYGGIRFESKIIEQNFKFIEDYEEDTKPILCEFVINDPPSQCRLCDQNFIAPLPLIIHLINDHAKTTTLTCPRCSQNSVNESTFVSHLKEHIDRNETTFDALVDKVTSKCRTIRPAKCRTSRRVTVDVVKRPWTKYQMRFLKTCDICSAEFSNRHKLVAHMRQKHIKKRRFDCEKCNRQITGQFNFYAHQYGHLTNEDQVNDLDDEVLQQNLRKFLDDNVYCDESSTDKPFGCRLCSYSASLIRKNAELHILQRHIYCVKMDRSHCKYTCEHCGMKFAISSNFERHKEIHTAPKAFNCTICHKTFANKRCVKSHLITHSLLKLHQCSACGKTFHTLNALNRHSRTHSDVTTKCTICDKELKSYRIKEHLRDVHENEHRPYSCSVCLQAFKTLKTLRNHSYRHTGERKFQCRFHCEEKFISSAARRAHERSKHESLKC